MQQKLSRDSTTVQKWTTVSLVCNGLNPKTQSIFSFFTCMLGYAYSMQDANFLIIIVCAQSDLLNRTCNVPSTNYWRRQQTPTWMSACVRELKDTCNSSLIKYKSILNSSACVECLCSCTHQIAYILSILCDGNIIKNSLVLNCTVRNWTARWIIIWRVF